jgi:hypothetical protein
MDNKSVDRRDVLRIVTATVAGVMFSPSQTAMAKEVAVSKIPAAVLEAANHAVKGAKWSTAHKSKGVFELEGKDANQHPVSVEVTHDGKVQGMERQIAAKDVPANVIKAATHKIPKFEVKLAHEIFHGTNILEEGNAEHDYELEGSAGKDHEAVVTVTAEAEIVAVKQEIALKDVPRTVSEGLAKAEPKFKPASVHQIEEDGAVTGYLFAGDFRKEKREVVAYVSADGKVVEVQKDDE